MIANNYFEGNPAMHALQRHKKIIDYLAENGFAGVAQLSEMFEVSQVTIRTDLRLLDEKGKIDRKHGGAALKEGEPLPFSFTSQALSERKSAIARMAISSINEGDTIFLDSSATVWHLALELRKLKNITVISHSIPIFEIFKDYSEGTLFGISGTLNHFSQSFVGHFAEETIRKLRATKAFISPNAILPEGLRCINMMEAAIRRCMIESSAETIVLADSSKFSNTFANSKALFGIDGFESVSQIYSDAPPTDETFINLFKEKKIRFTCSS
ncbi:DeoR/GlpR transcriptional regulator [Paenibacillus psychroresistens]|uniref:DeoR/GlpR transcriptional regulator n=1 Tax=Paenibacillus psychroresistens TaxID=1778678 RepID=A0A6B8RT93_9BACL|nr:DeoR/GlpR family DNA-binding transcription regulator [Paenibacillus psychroresistens]QGQ99700.1 DeoR/GlpR transcriptional regulator [Paenibacillus psychroresistens]